MTIAATIVDMANHPAAPLPVNEFDLEILRALVRGRRTEQRLVQRARIVLSAAEGQPNRRIATELGVAPMTVLLWRARYERAGLAGLADQARPGRPPTYGRDERDRVIALTLEPPSDGTTQLERSPTGRPAGDERDDRLADLAERRTQAPSGAAHWPQYVSSGSFAAPQFGQVRPSGAAHLLQNFRPGLFSL
jgi:hypothetical protein